MELQLDTRGVEAAKRAAGERAASMVEDGMRLGLGTGSTARWFIQAVGRRVADGLHVTGVPTSLASASLAAAVGIPLIDLGPEGLDLAVDGADCVDPSLRLIKGAGGALLREKVVAHAARRFVVVVDHGKLRDRLGGLLPVEILPFGGDATLAAVARVCDAQTSWRLGPDGGPAVSDNGNHLADVHVGTIENPELLAMRLQAVPGVVGHGLFIGLTDLVLAAHADGTVAELGAVD